jgi:hypothetical protein
MAKITMDAMSVMAHEYGVTPDFAGALAATRLSHIGRVSDRAPRISSAGLYVGICRRMDATVRDLDGRIVAAGWNHYSPREWLGRIGEFADYWNATQERASAVGSPYNAEPEIVFALWRARVPVRYARSMGQYARWAVLDGRVVWSLVVRSIRMARALGRASSKDICGGVAHRDTPRQGEAASDFRDLTDLTAKAWAAMGRVSPEMQEAMIAEICRRRSAGDRRTVLRPADLPWEVAARVQADMLADTTGRVRAAWSRGKKRARLVGAAQHPLAPAYPLVASTDIALRLVRGERPVDIANGELTRAEAHQWLQSGAEMSPVEWLCSRHTLPSVRSVAVARWLLSVRRRGQWSTLTRDRELRGPGGQTLTYRYFDRIDEIQDEDLDRGPSTGVDRAFEHAARRMGERWIEEQRNNHRLLAPLPSGWRLPSRMQHLATPAALVLEGTETRHCVGGYTGAVERRQSIILSIRAFGRRSTVELSPGGEVMQHRGPKNAAPHPVCTAVLRHFLMRNGLRDRRAA